MEMGAIGSGSLRFVNPIMRPLLLLTIIPPIRVSFRLTERPIALLFGMLTHNASLGHTVLAPQEQA